VGITNRQPGAVVGKARAFWQTFGPVLVGTACVLLTTLFNSPHSDLAGLRRDVVRAGEERLALATTAEAEERLPAIEGASAGGSARHARSYN
jgi:hypothetical protein